MNKIGPLIIIFLVLLFPFCLSLGFGAEDWFGRGLAALRSHHYEEAIAAFSKALEMDPDRIEAYNNRGISWCKKGEYDRAVDDYNKALEINSRAVEIYNNRGAIWFYKGEYDRAIDDYDKALGIDPRFVKAYNNRGAAWFLKGNRPMAVSDYKKALEINPNSAETSKQLAWIMSKDAGDSDFEAQSTTEIPKQDMGFPLKKDEVKSKSGVASGKGADAAKEKSQDAKPGELVDRFKATGAAIESCSKKAYSVQAGAFSSREKAENLTRLLKSKGYDARILSFVSWSGKARYAVRMGDYEIRREAEEKAVAFSERENMASTVRPAGEL